MSYFTNSSIRKKIVFVCPAIRFRLSPLRLSFIFLPKVLNEALSGHVSSPHSSILFFIFKNHLLKKNKKSQAHPKVIYYACFNPKSRIPYFQFNPKCFTVKIKFHSIAPVPPI